MTDSNNARHGLFQRERNQAKGVDIRSNSKVVTKANLKVNVSARMSVEERNTVMLP